MYAFYTKEQLQPLIDEALGDSNSQEQWLADTRAGIVKMVKSNALNYRAFGPGWILIKKYLQDAKLIGGTQADADIFAKFTLGDEFTDFMAAVAYQVMTTEVGSRLDIVRQVEDLESGDPIDWNCADDDMETGNF